MAEPYHGEPRRQVVNFSFFRIMPEWRRLPRQERQEHKEEAIQVLKRWNNEEMRLLTYSLMGTHYNCDMMLWRICYSLDCLSAAQTDLMKCRIGGYLETVHSFLSMTRRSQYQIGPNQPGPLRGLISPGKGRYMFVYPFTKSRSWYQLPFEERQRIVRDQMEVFDEYAHVRLHTFYSMGLDDQEFVLTFEGDHPDDFVDLKMRFRETENSAFIERDTPSFTCIRTTPEEMLERIG